MPEKILMKGDQGADVEALQGLLWGLGCVGPDNPFWSSSVAKRNNIRTPEDPKAKKFWIDGDFGTWTEEAVKLAQVQLIGPRKIPLDEITKPGVVDLDVWWALKNSEPEKQNQGVPATVQREKTALGAAIIAVWEHYIIQGLKEIPNGSNRGPYLPPLWPGADHGGIDWWIRYNPAKKAQGPAWCCYSRCGIEWEASGLTAGKGSYINSGGRIGLCYANYTWAKKQPRSPLHNKIDPKKKMIGWVVNKEDVVNGNVALPVGSAMIMNYGGTRGHTGSVARVIKRNGLPSKLELREGNISNSGGRRSRNITQSSIKWFIIAPALLMDADFDGTASGDIQESGDKERTT